MNGLKVLAAASVIISIAAAVYDGTTGNYAAMWSDLSAAGWALCVAITRG